MQVRTTVYNARIDSRIFALETPMTAKPAAALHARSAQAPKQQRGHARVAAIMQAGAEVFAERGYDKATMTEIAAHSGTAIGSLYRFFPSKESLADALLQRYAQHAVEGLAELEQRATELDASGLADALVDFMLEVQLQRSVVIALVDARSGGDDLRRQFRAAMRQSLAGVLRKALPALTPARARVVAVTVLHLLKGLAAANGEEPALRRLLIGEMRSLLRLYLASLD